MNVSELSKPSPQFRSESGRWYDPKTCKCVMEILGKNGKLRKPNIKDASERGLLPSVTSVMKVMDRPGLNRWKNQQLIMCSLTLPRVPGETDEQWVDRIIDDADALAGKAAETGKDFHSAAEDYWKHGTFHNPDPAIQKFLAGLVAWRQSMEERYPGLEWIAECPYHNVEFGVCGTPDIVAHNEHVLIVGDYKTMDLTKHKGTPKPYDEHAMQMACGLSSVKCQAPEHLGVELYVDRVTGEIRLHEWKASELYRGLKMFMHVVALWKVVNNWEERQAKNEV